MMGAYATTEPTFGRRPRLGLMLGVSDISGSAAARSSGGEESGSSSESDFSSLGTLFLVGMAFPQSSASLRDWLHSLPISRRAARTLAAELFVPVFCFGNSKIFFNRGKIALNAHGCGVDCVCDAHGI